MEITFIGYIALLLTVFFVVKGNWMMFLYAAVFFSGFSGSSVINIATISLQPAYYFFFCYLFTQIISGKKFAIRLQPTLTLFYIYCVISIVFPILYKNQAIIIMNQDGAYANLAFSVSNIGQIIYLTIDLLFLNSLIKYNGNELVKINLLKSFKWGFYAVLLVCVYQFFAFRFGWEFDYFFRQSVHGNVQGTRLYGPCDEASMLCYYLVPAMLIVFQTKAGWQDSVALLFATGIGVITKSSTFLIGFILFFIAIIPSLIANLGKRHSFSWWLIRIIVLLVIAAAAMLFFRSEIFEIINLFIEKLKQGNQSGQERFSAMFEMIKVGLKYPTGVGFGSARSKDLFSTWFCNIGIIGMLLYIVFLFSFLRNAKRNKQLSKALPYLIVVVLMFISVPEPYNFFIWYALFLGVAVKPHMIRHFDGSVLMEKTV